MFLVFRGGVGFKDHSLLDDDGINSVFEQPQFSRYLLLCRFFIYDEESAKPV